jgi:TonB family protein
MFDKLIESEPQGADFKTRWRYFMVSSLIVGVFFVTAVVFSLYAADISLGSDNIYLNTILAPVERPPAKPEIEELRPERHTSVPDSPMPTRQINMARVEESKFVPDSISVVQNKHLARPETDRFKIDPRAGDSGPAHYGGPARGTFGGSTGPAGTGLATTSFKTEAADPETPPVVKPPPPVKRTVSDGVVNGKATYLPVPIYSATARAVGAAGKVDVQVTIDEYGTVISAKAVSGNPLLRADAEKAAWRAKFSPTYLSKVPVKVTGVIVYNFTR